MQVTIGAPDREWMSQAAYDFLDHLNIAQDDTFRIDFDIARDPTTFVAYDRVSPRILSEDIKLVLSHNAGHLRINFPDVVWFFNARSYFWEDLVDGSVFELRFSTTEAEPDFDDVMSWLQPLIDAETVPLAVTFN